ncbi:MAG: hypothetical protein ACAH83_15070 [Alphaproteobacteria bacterium]
MPILFILTVVVQVLFALHAHRTGRDRWIFLILIFPAMGCLIYFIAEVLPEVIHGPAGQKARSKIKSALDPEKEYREAKYAFETAPTVANRLRLAQILTVQRDYDAVIALLQPALTDHFKDDPMLLEGLAYAYYDKGDYRNVLLYIQKLFDREDYPPADYIKLLRIRSLIALGELEMARAELTHLIDFFTGEEARIALAQLHERMGAPGEARKIYQDILTRAKHAPQYYQKKEREWIEVAQRALVGLG